jgi:hypothetical protein
MEKIKGDVVKKKRSYFFEEEEEKKNCVSVNIYFTLSQIVNDVFSLLLE